MATLVPPTGRIVSVPAGALRLEGICEGPPRPQGLVIFAHGSGSGRMSPRNRFVAETLHAAGFATLLMDLLTPEENADYATRFDIPLLAERLMAAVAWARADAATSGLPTGLFGASTGAAAALEVAARLGPAIAAVVSRGGRPDLASDPSLARVTAPTQLIVGGDDTQVLRLNEAAHARLTCAKALVVVPNATHLFEEPGGLEAVAGLAGEWFGKHLRHRAA